MEEEKSPGLFEKLLPESESILDEPALLDLFTTRVEELMQHDLDLLLSSLYRLDVEEYKIQRALRSGDVPPARGIAQLILERQKERLRTKSRYFTGEKPDWDGL
ncbi:MAG TPA: hypothetical protein VGK46_04550 [Saprospiraceae bacterium]